MELSKKHRVYFLLNLSVSAIFVLVIFINSIGYNLLTFNKGWSFRLQFLFPQGWAFFTKDPREDITSVYKIEHGRPRMLNLKNGAANSYLGISRKNRVMLIEMAQILNQVDTSRWMPVESREAFDSFSDTARPLEVINFVNRARLFGEYIILKQKPLPWSWRDNKNNLYMPAKAIKIDLKPL